MLNCFEILEIVSVLLSNLTGILKQDDMPRMQEGLYCLFGVAAFFKLGRRVREGFIYHVGLEPESVRRGRGLLIG